MFVGAFLLHRFFAAYMNVPGAEKVRCCGCCCGVGTLRICWLVCALISSINLALLATISLRDSLPLHLGTAGVFFWFALLQGVLAMIIVYYVRQLRPGEVRPASSRIWFCQIAMLVLALGFLTVVPNVLLLAAQLVFRVEACSATGSKVLRSINAICQYLLIASIAMHAALWRPALKRTRLTMLPNEVGL